jgi:hypothetical protein
MSHHGDNPFDGKGSFGPVEDLLKEVPKAPVPGPTGEFPEGKLTPEDKGSLTFTIGTKNGKVIIDFGAPVSWIGFTADQAFEIAMELAKIAAEAKSTEIIVVPG